MARRWSQRRFVAAEASGFPFSTETTIRIVSLLPSATEIVCDLGLRQNLVGVSHECDFPKGVRDLPVVTSSVIPKNAASNAIDESVRTHLETHSALYSLDVDLLTRLQPDLIVTQALCDVCAVSIDDVNAAVLAMAGESKVVNLEPMCLDDVFETMILVGSAAGIDSRARERVSELKRRVAAVEERTNSAGREPIDVAFLEWIDPPFNAGHWTPELVRIAGGRDRLGNEGQPSMMCRWNDLIELRPDVLCIACCGFELDRVLRDLPLLATRDGWDELPCVRSARVYVFDGNAYFNRPGPRLVDSLEALAYTLYPDLHPRPIDYDDFVVASSVSDDLYAAG